MVRSHIHAKTCCPFSLELTSFYVQQILPLFPRVVLPLMPPLGSKKQPDGSFRATAEASCTASWTASSPSPSSKPRTRSPRKKSLSPLEALPEAAVLPSDLKQVNRFLKLVQGARGGGGGRAAAVARRRRSSWGIRKWLCPSPATLRTLVTLAVLIGAIGWSNARFFAGISAASEAVGGVVSAAGEVAGAGANATVKVTLLGLQALSTASSFVEEFMHGIDVTDMNVRQTSCKLVAERPEHLIQWFNRRNEFPPECKVWLAEQVIELSMNVPAFDVQHELFALNGSYVRMRLRCRLRQDTTLAAALVVTLTDFEAEWSFPMWSDLGFSHKTKTAAIIQQVFDGAEKLKIPAQLLDISEQGLVRDLSSALGWTAWVPGRRGVLFGVSAGLLSLLGWLRSRAGSFELLFLNFWVWELRFFHALQQAAAHHDPVQVPAPPSPSFPHRPRSSSPVAHIRDSDGFAFVKVDGSE